MELTYRGSGKAVYNDKEYDCDLYLNDDEGGILINLIIKKPIAGYLSLPLEMDSLHGELSTGYRFTLVNCSREKMSNNISEGRSIYTYSAKFMLKGVGEKDGREQYFYKMDFSIPNIMMWGGVSGYKIEDYGLFLTNDDQKRKMYSDDKFTINYWVGNSLLPVVQSDLLSDKIVLKQIGNIEINFNTPVPVKEFVNVFDKTKRLMELSTLRKIHPEEVTGWSADVYDMYDSKKIERPVSVLYYDSKKQKEIENNKEFSRSWKWLSLTELLDNNSFACYFFKYDILEPVIELYIEIIHSNESSSRRVFLNLVQALETYHSRIVTNNLTEFRNRIDTVILKNRPEEWKEEDRKFLLANSRKFITLESRLADLLLSEFQYRFDTGNIKYYDFPNVIALTRNYYIHYDESIKNKGRVLSEEELSIYNRCLFGVLEYYLMKEIGFSDTNVIRKKLKERWGEISDTLSIIEASKKRKNDADKSSSTNS